MVISWPRRAQREEPEMAIVEKAKATAVTKTTDGHLDNSYDTLESAEAAARDKNSRAEDMGIKTRYVAESLDN